MTSFAPLYLRPQHPAEWMYFGDLNQDTTPAGPVVRPYIAIRSGDVVPANRFVITVPMHFEESMLLGLGSTVVGGDADLWVIYAPVDAQPDTIGRLLAGLAINLEEPIARAGMMPNRPSTLYVLPSGEMRTGRGKRLAQWARDEVERLASVLCVEHLGYLQELLAALRCEPVAQFRVIPPDFILRDAHGTMRIGPAPCDIAVDLSKSERRRLGLGWHQVLARDYSRNRYLRHLSDEQLGERAEHIMANAHEVSATGLISLDNSKPETFYWLGLLQEIATEMALRHGPYPSGWRRGLIERRHMPGSLDSAQLNRHLCLPGRNQSPLLVKYTKFEFARNALANGSIRLAPADSYDDPSLSSAVRDSELTAEIDYDPFALGIVQAPNLDTIFFSSSVQRLRIKAAGNYYVFCMSEAFSNRLLYDFEAGVALVVTDTEEFLKRVDAAIGRALPIVAPYMGLSSTTTPCKSASARSGCRFRSISSMHISANFVLRQFPPMRKG